MNRDNLNYANNLNFINNNSNQSLYTERNTNVKEYSTLNSIHTNSGIYNNSDKEENKEINKLKISVLLKEIKNVIENPDYNLNFQLIHMKCFNLNQLGLHLEFFDQLKNCLLNLLKNYTSELISFNNSLSSHLKNGQDEKNFNKNYNKQGTLSKKYLNLFINKYEEYKKICMKISETISILDIKYYYLNKFKIKEDEEINFDLLANKQSNKSEILQMNFIFKIIFSLFFQYVLLDDTIQKDLLNNFFKAYGKIRKNFQNYVQINKEICNYLVTTKKKDNKNFRITNSDDSSLGTLNEKNLSSNLKLNENNLDLDKDSKENKYDKYIISNFANIKKDDTIFKIKGILQKKKFLDNRNYSSLKSIRDINKNLIELNENVSTKRKAKIKITLKDRLKAIFNIFNDANSLSILIDKNLLDSTIIKFDECFLSETKIFYKEYCNNYFQKIKDIESLNKINSRSDLIDKEKITKAKFSHYDISILNYNSDCENPTENYSPKEMLNNKVKICNTNLIDLDFNAYKSNKNDKIFINKKIPKENNLKSAGDIININYNTYSGENDILDEKDIYCKFDSFHERKYSNAVIAKFKDCKKKKNKLNLEKMHITIEKFIVEITYLFELESEISFNYVNKNEIINLILELSLNEYESSISDSLRKFIDSSDLVIIKLLFALYSKNEVFKEKFNKILSNTIISILSDLEKNHIIINRHNRVEYVNFLFFVEEIFDIKKKFYLILKESLNAYSRNELIIKTCLEKIVNKNFDFMENFVKLIHDEIKISIKNKNPYRLKDFNDKFLAIYKLFNEKDLFEIEYRKYLSKRLLRNSSMVKETEHELYEILKKESGAIYTRKIEKILKEISLSYDLNVEYSQKYAGNIKKNIFINDNIYNKNNSSENNKNTNPICIKGGSNHNLNKHSNMDSNLTHSNLVFSNNDEQDKYPSGLTPKLSNDNFNHLNSNRISEVNNFNQIVKEDHLKSDVNNHLNGNINNYTPINSNNNNNNFNMMKSYLTNTIKNPNTKSNINSLIFKANNVTNSAQIFENEPSITHMLQTQKCLFESKSFIPLRTINKYIDINVKVVSSDCWLLENINIKNNKRLNISEIKKNQEFSLPEVLDKYINNFKEFYSNKFKNRQLKWIHEYSYAFIDMRLKDGKVYNIIASNYQMGFLCLFNKNKYLQILFVEILKILNVSMIENKSFIQLLKSHFLPLFNSKLFLIKNKEKEEINEIDENDLIYLNHNFNQEESKIKLLNLIVEKKEINTTEEKKENEVSHFVLEDRKHQLDAIIIKILKKNKIVEFENLKSLVNEEVKKFFVLETKFIKTRIENLIDRNFVKRNEDNTNCYEYI